MFCRWEVNACLSRRSTNFGSPVPLSGQLKVLASAGTSGRKCSPGMRLAVAPASALGKGGGVERLALRQMRLRQDGENAWTAAQRHQHPSVWASSAESSCALPTHPMHAQPGRERSPSHWGSPHRHKEPVASQPLARRRLSNWAVTSGQHWAVARVPTAYSGMKHIRGGHASPPLPRQPRPPRASRPRRGSHRHSAFGSGLVRSTENSWGDVNGWWKEI